MCQPVVRAGLVAGCVTVGPRKIIVVDDMDDFRPMPHFPPKDEPTNCVNCGAPHEPVCSYCGTKGNT